MFVGRTQELATLRSSLSSRAPALIVVTGRPKTGKTRLILEASARQSVIYLQASSETAALNFQAFKRACLTALGTECNFEDQNDWMSLLSAVAVVAQKRADIIIVLDNFNALLDADDTLPFTIRTFWQSGLVSNGGLKLILCGSNIARMTDLTRGTPALAQHALAGCNPQLIDLMPLSLGEASHFLPGYSDEACIAAYAIFGGVPAYLRALDPQKGLGANITDLFLSPNGRFIEEPLNLLFRDLRDPKVYASILRAISNGYRESGDIKAFILGGQSGVSISSYLEKLRAMRLINDVRAIDADPKARYIRFSLSDPMTRFWNLFVQPNRVAIDRGEGAHLFETAIRHQLSDYMVLAFEEVCRDFIRNHGRLLFEKRAAIVGQTWGQGYDIAVAARLADDTPVFGACAWSTRTIGEAGAEYLMQQVRNAHQAPENPSPPGGKSPLPYYVMFSRSGFTSEVQERARQSDILKLVIPADIIQRNQADAA